MAQGNTNLNYTVNQVPNHRVAAANYLSVPPNSGGHAAAVRNEIPFQPSGTFTPPNFLGAGSVVGMPHTETPFYPADMLISTLTTSPAPLATSVAGGVANPVSPSPRMFSSGSNHPSGEQANEEHPSGTAVMASATNTGHTVVAGEGSDPNGFPSVVYGGVLVGTDSSRQSPLGGLEGPTGNENSPENLPGTARPSLNPACASRGQPVVSLPQSVHLANQASRVLENTVNQSGMSARSMHEAGGVPLTGFHSALVPVINPDLCPSPSSYLNSTAATSVPASVYVAQRQSQRGSILVTPGAGGFIAAGSHVQIQVDDQQNQHQQQQFLHSFAHSSNPSAFSVAGPAMEAEQHSVSTYRSALPASVHVQQQHSHSIGAGSGVSSASPSAMSVTGPQQNPEMYVEMMKQSGDISLSSVPPPGYPSPPTHSPMLRPGEGEDSGQMMSPAFTTDYPSVLSAPRQPEMIAAGHHSLLTMPVAAHHSVIQEQFATPQRYSSTSLISSAPYSSHKAMDLEVAGGGSTNGAHNENRPSPNLSLGSTPNSKAEPFFIPSMVNAPPPPLPQKSPTSSPNSISHSKETAPRDHHSPLSPSHPKNPPPSAAQGFAAPVARATRDPGYLSGSDSSSSCSSGRRGRHTSRKNRVTVMYHNYYGDSEGSARGSARMWRRIEEEEEDKEQRRCCSGRRSARRGQQQQCGCAAHYSVGCGCGCGNLPLLAGYERNAMNDHPTTSCCGGGGGGDPGSCLASRCLPYSNVGLSHGVYTGIIPSPPSSFAPPPCRAVPHSSVNPNLHGNGTSAPTQQSFQTQYHASHPQAVPQTASKPLKIANTTPVVMQWDEMIQMSANAMLSQYEAFANAYFEVFRDALHKYHYRSIIRMALVSQHNQCNPQSPESIPSPSSPLQQPLQQYSLLQSAPRQQTPFFLPGLRVVVDEKIEGRDKQEDSLGTSPMVGLPSHHRHHHHIHHSNSRSSSGKHRHETSKGSSSGFQRGSDHSSPLADAPHRSYSLFSGPMEVGALSSNESGNDGPLSNAILNKLISAPLPANAQEMLDQQEAVLKAKFHFAEMQYSSDGKIFADQEQQSTGLYNSEFGYHSNLRPLGTNDTTGQNNTFLVPNFGGYNERYTTPSQCYSPNIGPARQTSVASFSPSAMGQIKLPVFDGINSVAVNPCSGSPPTLKELPTHYFPSFVGGGAKRE